MMDGISEVMREKWSALAKDEVRIRAHARFADMDEDFWPLYDHVHDYTMTSVERLYDLYKTVEYVVKAKIPGAIVECGVWKGGSMMLVALALQKLGDTDRDLRLYDTFEGLPYPASEHDVDLLGNVAAERWRQGWIKVSIEDVIDNMIATGYPQHNLRFIPGMVEGSLPKIETGHSGGRMSRQEYEQFPIAIARLDTDWYDSTVVEIERLWPRISCGGFLIIDDYGHWQGARKATDDYFADKAVKMTRVDYSCRVIQKP